MNTRAQVAGTLTMIGGLLLVAGAALIDAGWLTGRPSMEAAGNALAAAAGLGLLWLPLSLHAVGAVGDGSLARLGTGCFVLGTAIASLVDVPAALDPADLGAGRAAGPAGLLLLAAGFLIWAVAARRAGRLGGRGVALLFVAGLWPVISFPLIQLPLFVIPHDRPLFLLLAGVLGAVQALIGLVIRDRATRPLPVA